MRLIALFLNILFVFQMTWIPLPAYAAAVSYSPSTGINGEASVNKVGSLLLASGLAVMSGSTIEITSKGQSQLHGNLVKMSMSGSNIDAIAFFDQGLGLSKLDAHNCSESVDLLDGSKIKGPVSAVNTFSLVCGGQSVAMSDVKAIHSARAFNISTKAAENPKISFESTCVKVAAAKNKEHSSLTKIIIVCAVLTAIACAITLPIVIPLASGRHHNNNSNYQNAVFYNNYINSRKPVVVVSSGSGP